MSASPSERPPSPSAFSLSDLALLTVVVIWGTNYTVVKEALDTVPALAFMSLRFGLAAAAMGVLLLWLEGWKPLPRATLLRLMGLGLVGNTLYQLCFMLGLSHTTAANSGMLAAVTPVLVTVLGGVLGLDRLTRPVLMALVLAVPGMLLVVGARGPELSAETRLGDLLILGGSACWAIYTVGIRAMGTELSAMRITAMAMLTGAPGVVLVGLPEVLRLEPARIGVGAWAGLVYSALIPLVLSYFVWSRSVQKVGSSRTSLYNAGIPVVAALTAWGIRGERPTALQAAGAALILSGVLVSRRR
ncbi:DMT family transporter [Hyalangium rubrum]|uniref:DMT family transporter n=1 Tax=Hyalangium rubrum TaxID=3103134 RepID=A0ABU5HAZ6_9BACT|nr:DMT family transporter [Hyalangium sp. s54d21]MDY7230644.1 DMT family transporter [Hyalangium sp. s54d21]